MVIAQPLLNENESTRGGSCGPLHVVSNGNRKSGTNWKFMHDEASLAPATAIVLDPVTGHPSVRKYEQIRITGPPHEVRSSGVRYMVSSRVELGEPIPSH